MNKYIRLIIPYLLLFFIALIPLSGLFPKGLPHGHDTQDHVARIANFYLSLSEGNFIPRWGGNLNWGFGHPVIMFLYPFSSYLSSFIHFLGFSFVDTTKITFGVLFIASMLGMYLWAKDEFGKKSGFIAALLYGFAPYRFIDLYVRGAIGEHAAFVFPPIIFYFLRKISSKCGNKKRELKDYYFACVGLTVSIGCLILSHNAMALMFLPIIGLYGIYCFFFIAKKSIRFLVYGIISALLGFGWSAFFWFPAFFEGKYTLRNIVTVGEVLKRFVPWKWFFYSPWNWGGGTEFSKEIGVAGWIGIIFSCIYLFRSKKKEIKVFIAGALCIFILSLFLMTSYTNSIWRAITLLQNFQFPWRFLSVSVFMTAVLGGIAGSAIFKNGDKKNEMEKIPSWYYPLFVLCSIGIVVSTTHMWKPKDYLYLPESFYTGIYPGTTDTGESSPIWSIRFMENAPAFPIEVISGEASISSVFKNTTHHEYTVVASTKVQILENTIYFPGWKVLVDGKEVEVQYQDPHHRGLLTFWIDEGVHTLQIIFTDTKLRVIANIISLSTIGIVMLIGLFIFFRKKK